MLAMREWLLQVQLYELFSLHCLQLYAVPNYFVLYYLQPEPSLRCL